MVFLLVNRKVAAGHLTEFPKNMPSVNSGRSLNCESLSSVRRDASYSGFCIIKIRLIRLTFGSEVWTFKCSEI